MEVMIGVTMAAASLEGTKQVKQAKPRRQMGWDMSSWRSIPECNKECKNICLLNTDFFPSLNLPFPFLPALRCPDFILASCISDLSLISIYTLFSTRQSPPLLFSDSFFLPPILCLVLIISGNNVCYDILWGTDTSCSPCLAWTFGSWYHDTSL